MPILYLAKTPPSTLSTFSTFEIRQKTKQAKKFKALHFFYLMQLPGYEYKKIERKVKLGVVFLFTLILVNFYQLFL